MTYRFRTTCPKCGKQDEITSETDTATANCGDCLWEHTEVVPLSTELIVEDMFMVVTRTWPGGWCKDADEKAALRRLRGDWRREIDDYGFGVYIVHPDTYCEEVHGAFVHPVGRPPKLVHTHNGRKNKKV